MADGPPATVAIGLPFRAGAGAPRPSPVAAGSVNVASGATVAVDQDVIAALRATYGATPFEGRSKAPAPPPPAPPPAPSLDRTAAIDSEELARLRAAYRDGTPFGAAMVAERPPPTRAAAPRTEAAATQPIVSPSARPMPMQLEPAALPPIVPARAMPAQVAEMPAPLASPAPQTLGRTADFDRAELKALRDAHGPTPFRSLLPTERGQPKALAPPVSAEPAPPRDAGKTGIVSAAELEALRAAHATPFQRKRRTPQAPFSEAWSEAFLMALGALSP